MSSLFFGCFLSLLV
uniref:Uncharacterized protein n=1 Tax=Arundo donax TaxID=35708 RepID=A0A0A9C8J7_ARUDO